MGLCVVTLSLGFCCFVVLFVGLLGVVFPGVVWLKFAAVWQTNMCGMQDANINERSEKHGTPKQPSEIWH